MSDHQTPLEYARARLALGSVKQLTGNEYLNNLLQRLRTGDFCAIVTTGWGSAPRVTKGVFLGVRGEYVVAVRIIEYPVYAKTESGKIRHTADGQLMIERYDSRYEITNLQNNYIYKLA